MTGGPRLFRSCLALAGVMCSATASPATYEASSIADVQSRINSAVAGDVIFECTGDGAYLTIAGDDAEVDRNELRNKKTVGNMIDVRRAGSQVAQRVRIHHNYFHDFSSPGVNGAETIRFGLSGPSLSKGLGLIEHNLFVRCIGENELMSIKSASNTIRYNSLLGSPGAQLTLRRGNENLVYGNSLRGTDGPTIDSAKDDYGVALDLDGQPRTGRKDKGADEVSQAPVAAALLTPGDSHRLIHDRR